MECQIFNWAGERRCGEVIKQFGYEHLQVIEVADYDEVFQIAQQFCEAKINVMVVNLKSGGVLLSLDSKSFSQR